jgi:branched-chain amino acid aminotransferase
MKEPIYYFNNKLVPKSKAKVSVHDMGFLRSYGVVDFLITYEGKPFYLKDHIDRLYNSAKLIDLNIPFKKEQLIKKVLLLVAKNNFPEAGIWIIVTGGIGPTSMIPAKKPTLLILVDSYEPYPKEYYQKGVKIITFEEKRIVPQVKSMIYTLAIQALQKAYTQKAIEALYVKDGKVFECMTSNFFIFQGNKLLTAKDKDVLSGVTRRIVLEISNNHFQAVKTNLSLKQVLAADEAFLTASNKEIMPVVKIDNHIIGNGKVGENTKKLMQLFRKKVQEIITTQNI